MTVTLSPDTISKREAVHRIDSEGRYRIDNYDAGPVFSSFLPGVGGPNGVPLWCLYVNRGQGVVSFGIEGKNGAILEFLPATWAYQLVPLQGFRSFLKWDGEFYEPFQQNEAALRQQYTRSMWIEPDALTLEERNETHETQVRVSYFTLVGSPLPALVRRVIIENTSNRSRRLELLDGLPLIQPAGFSDIQMKKVRRLSEAYSCAMREGDTVFYAARVKMHDEAEVEEVEDGNFHAAFAHSGESRLAPLKVVVDPDVVFGPNGDFTVPRCFVERTSLDLKSQVWENRLGCGLSLHEAELAPGERVELFSLTGYAFNHSMAASLVSRFRTANAFEDAREGSRRLIEEITQPAFTVSSHRFFDGYCRQNFLDNILRGGVPVKLPARSGSALIHIYSRRHGDLERDYNEFRLAPHPLSEGEGNFRDILQNQRSDVWFYPDIEDLEIRKFVSLLQADGYNPLSVHGCRFFLKPDSEVADLCPVAHEKGRRTFTQIVSRPFAAGELLGWLMRFAPNQLKPEEWLRSVLRHCDCRLIAKGHEGGYWIDHWTYIVDLLESYEAIYPERVEAMLTEQVDIGWFDEGAFVRPRDDKYKLRPGGPLQLDAVESGAPSRVELPPTTLIGKLVTLLTLKAFSLDHRGVGTEMEAGRPGWNDAMNGLPSLFGSSSCETAETLRLARWLLQRLPAFPDTPLPRVVAGFLHEALSELRRPGYDWERSAGIRERYRARLRENSSSESEKIAGADLRSILEAIEGLAAKGVEQARDEKSGLLHTYFANEPQDITPLPREDGNRRESAAMDAPQNVRISRFAAKPLPLFLEGQVHWLRVLDRKEETRRIYQSLRKSPLFDEQLQAYKLNEPLTECSPRIGRARTFSRGWYENESIWVHMTHKYLIELLRQGLVQEFFQDAETMLVPFLNPNVYGRSVLENSSFIASSACPDPGARGRGFVARLSGTTAEFIQIWRLLTIGERPFRHEGDRLRLELRPVLPGSWFLAESRSAIWKGKPIELREGDFACAFLGQTLLIYHNSTRADTFGPNAVAPKGIILDGGPERRLAELTPDEVSDIRERRFSRIDVTLG